MQEERGKRVAVGIDLGTTYSCVGVWQHGRVEIIPNEQGNRTTPSYVAFTQSGRLVGDAAKYQAAYNAPNTVFDTKRLIGREFKDAVVQNGMKLWPFKVIPSPDVGGCKRPKIGVIHNGEEKQFFVEEISAMILMKMKEVADAYLGCNVKNVVVTVPAYFNNMQRQATKDAGVIAGLNVMRIINEPAAAAIAYGLHKKAIGLRKNVLVFDLGGGTFDVSLVTLENDVFEVKSVNGNTHLGGVDFDNRMVNHFAAEFERKHGFEITKDSTAIGRLRSACERAKRALSLTTEAAIEIDCLYKGLDFSSSITRARFEQLNIDLFEKCIDLVEKCLGDAKIEKSDVHEVVLVGGSSKIPKVQQLLQDCFHGKELCKSINPDQAVAYGAAAHAAILNGVDDKNFVLVDVTPFSIGVGAISKDGAENFSAVIPRNTPIPTRKERMFTTVRDSQCTMAVIVYEGDEVAVWKNRRLARFQLCGIPSAPKGVPRINQCFEIDNDGILKCSAQELTTGNKSEIIITEHSGRLSQKEVPRMAEDAEKVKAEDEEGKRKIEAMTALKCYVVHMKSILSILGNMVRLKDKRKMGDAIEQTVHWLDLNSRYPEATKIEDKLKELESICEPIIKKTQLQYKDNGLGASGAAAKLEIVEID